MNWKTSLIACISTGLSVAMPQNIIGCAGGYEDPHDYFTHFFNAHQWDNQKSYTPYYYTGVAFLYSGEDVVRSSDTLFNEWQNYFGNRISGDDLAQFFYNGDTLQMWQVYQHVNAKTRPLLNDAYAGNPLTDYFMTKKKKDIATLRYMLYAKSVEPYVLGNEYDWEAYKRDSSAMAVLIERGLKEYNALKKREDLKLKYAYQLVRLCHYSGNAVDALKYYDLLVAHNKTASVLKELSLALRGGALYRLGQHEEAAYEFSKCFNASKVNRYSNYLGFLWSTNERISMEPYLAFCKNDKERSGMLLLFGLTNPNNAFDEIQQLSDIAPASPELEVLCVREINKAEEQFLTPLLNTVKGGYDFNGSGWNTLSNQDDLQERIKTVQQLQTFLETMASNPSVVNRAFYLLSASYCSMMLEDLEKSAYLLNEAAKYPMGNDLKAQWEINRLLLTINAAKVIDAETEAKILPSLQWLLSKSKESGINRYDVIYRNVFAQVLAKKYRTQGNKLKEILSVAAADKVAWNQAGLQYLRENANPQLIEQVYGFFTNKHLSAFDKFIRANNTLNESSVAEFMGTVYLRAQQYDKAVEWFQKFPDSTPIYKNPFIELYFDREERLPNDKVVTNKLDFARAMYEVQRNILKGKNLFDNYYTMGLGLYNTTYYGYAWELVEYYRSGNDGYSLPDDATDFQREYFSAESAYQFFEKAYNATSDKERKAKALFMMAKCAQKQIFMPKYESFKLWESYDRERKAYYEDFKNNVHFEELYEKYRTTKTYMAVYNSCSYLRDFVKKLPNTK